MFQTNSDISIKDHKSENNSNPAQPFSLPLIPNKPNSRGEPILRKQISKKQKIGLPNIKENQAPPNIYSDLQDRKSVSEKQNKNTLAREVEEKLKMVLGGMQPSKADEQMIESYDSDDFDFEAQINKNKELIKQHKIKKEMKVIHATNQKQKVNNLKIPKPLKHRNESLYEKRAKQYKDQSIENKYLSKRKQTLKQKNNIRESSKDIKQRQDVNLSKDYKDKFQPIRRSKSKANNNRVLSQKSSAKNLQQINKSVNLFDGIQNYLENPREKRIDQKQPLIGLSLLKAKRDIEDKLKAINQQLGHSDQQDFLSQKKGSDQKTNIEQSDYINNEWRRVHFNNEKQVVCQDSNFDKELDRINSLQEKNALSLEKYLEYQKMLLEIDVHRKSATYRKQVSSSQ